MLLVQQWAQNNAGFIIGIGRDHNNVSWNWLRKEWSWLDLGIPKSRSLEVTQTFLRSCKEASNESWEGELKHFPIAFAFPR